MLPDPSCGRRASGHLSHPSHRMPGRAQVRAEVQLDSMEVMASDLDLPTVVA